MPSVWVGGPRRASHPPYLGLTFVLWVEMPAGVDTLKLHRDALKHRINTAPGALFSVKDRYKNCLRMNCGLPWGEPIEAALKTLGELAGKQIS